MSSVPAGWRARPAARCRLGCVLELIPPWEQVSEDEVVVYRAMCQRTFDAELRAIQSLAQPTVANPANNPSFDGLVSLVRKIQCPVFGPLQEGTKKSLAAWRSMAVRDDGVGPIQIKFPAVAHGWLGETKYRNSPILPMR